MKSIKVTSGLLACYFLFISLGSQFTACTKTTVIHDTIPSSDLTEGLIAYFPFTNGSLKDSSGKNNHIIFNNASQTVDKSGNGSNAYLFNGTGSYMRISNSASLNPQHITIMAVVKVNDFFQGACHVNQILGKGTPDYTNGFYCLRFSDYPPDCSFALRTDKEYFLGAFGDNASIPGAPGAGADSVYIQKNNWYTVVYTYDGVESRLYINGALKKLTVKSGVFTPNSNDVFIGKHEGVGYPYYFNGVIDEIRIYNKALSISQVQRLQM